jgi:hypothetical protein
MTARLPLLALSGLPLGFLDLLHRPSLFLGLFIRILPILLGRPLGFELILSNTPVLALSGSGNRDGKTCAYQQQPGCVAFHADLHGKLLVMVTLKGDGLT